MGNVFANNFAAFFIWARELQFLRSSGALFHSLTASPMHELNDDKLELPISISLPEVIALAEVDSKLDVILL